MRSLTRRWETVGRAVDWLIRGHFILQLLISLGVGKLVQWIVTKYAQVSSSLATAVWLLATAAALQILLAVFREKAVVQQTSLQSAGTAGKMEKDIDTVDSFYKTNAGPMLEEVEAHFQRLAAHHRNPSEREKFLVRAISAGALSYLHDMTWFTIYRSQVDALSELNRQGAMIVENLQPFYDAAATANRDIYRKYPFESWLGYLIAQGVVRQDGNVVQITVRGKDFLKYLIQFGRSAKDRRY